MQIDFHPTATEELENSADWYAERSVAAARRFAIAVEEAIDKIIANPARFPLIHARHRAW